MDKLYYFDISYRRTSNGPMGVVRRADMDGVIDWIQKTSGQFQSVVILKLPGELPGLQDREVSCRHEE